MIRAMVDYFFGGAPEEPQSPLETQEVNDWLVVNMADRPQDDLVMIESTKPDPMSDSEYEDILDAVSCLMRAVEEPIPELEPSDGESTEESTDSEEEEEEEERKIVPIKLSILDSVGQNPPSLPYSTSQMYWDHGIDERALYMSRLVEFGSPLTEDSFTQTSLYWGCQITEQEVVQHFETVPVDNRMKAFNPFDCEDVAFAQELMEEAEDCMLHAKLLNELLCPETRIVHCKAEPEMPNNRFVLPRRYARMYSHVLDATSKDYTSLHKAEIQQRIHEVEREQKLKKYKSEKAINKGQLNRQNKNYLFQSSCKKNRRRDLQRSHSGANNNRKCSC